MLSTLEQLYKKEPRAAHARMVLEHFAMCHRQSEHGIIS